MAIAIRTDAETLKITRVSDGLELDLEPIQGMWTEAQYLKLTDATNRLIEFTDGQIEVLPMPTYKHQMIFRFIFLALMTFVEPLGGRVLFAALRMQVRPGKFREPDILLLRDANDSRCQNRYWLGADLVVEVVSEDNPERDTVEKVLDYAEAGIPEYWIVNPQDETVRVLSLQGERYAEHGLFRRGAVASSALLEGFTLPLDALFDAV